MYSRYDNSNRCLVLYINVLLMTRVIMDTNTKIRVPENMSDCPRPNQAVSEKGIYMLRKIMANNTEKVIVPII